MKKIKCVILKFISRQGNLFRYSSSFCMLLGLLPSLIILLKLFQKEILNNPNIVNILYWYLPEVLISPFVEYVLTKQYNTYLSLIISMIISIYLASNGCYSFILIAMDDENFVTYKILIRIKAVFLFVTLVVGLLLIVFVNYFFNNYFILGMGFFILFYFFYRFLSFKKHDFKYGIIGAFFTCSGLILVGMGYTFYIENYTRYNFLYGPLASIMVLLISIYLISSIIYFGYCLNYEYNNSTKAHIYKHMWYYNRCYKLIKKLTELLKCFNITDFRK